MNEKAIPHDYAAKVIEQLLDLQEVYIRDHIKRLWTLPILRRMVARGLLLQTKPPMLKEELDGKLVIS